MGWPQWTVIIFMAMSMLWDMNRVRMKWKPNDFIIGSLAYHAAVIFVLTSGGFFK